MLRDRQIETGIEHNVDGGWSEGVNIDLNNKRVCLRPRLITSPSISIILQTILSPYPVITCYD